MLSTCENSIKYWEMLEPTNEQYHDDILNTKDCLSLECVEPVSSEGRYSGKMSRKC